jgi:hypothetical protein
LPSADCSRQTKPELLSAKACDEASHQWVIESRFHARDVGLCDVKIAHEYILSVESVLVIYPSPSDISSLTEVAGIPYTANHKNLHIKSPFPYNFFTLFINSPTQHVPQVSWNQACL